MLVRSAVQSIRVDHNTQKSYNTINRIYFRLTHTSTTMASASSYGEIPGTHESPNHSHTNSIEMLTTSDQHDSHWQKPMASDILSHSLSPSDPDNPMAWPIHRKLYVSLCGYLCAASV